MELIVTFQYYDGNNLKDYTLSLIYQYSACSVITPLPNLETLEISVTNENKNFFYLFANPFNIEYNPGSVGESIVYQLVEEGTATAPSYLTISEYSATQLQIAVDTEGSIDWDSNSFDLIQL